MSPRKHILRIFALYLAMFILLAAYFIKFIALDSKNVIGNSYNPRLNQSYNSVSRGRVLDANGVVLADNDDEYDAQARIYPYGGMYAHVIGYSALGKAGIEAKYNFDLQKADNELLQRLLGMIKNDTPVGNSLVLTIDHDLQSRAYELLSKERGAIVVMEPRTGKILAMVSNPTFDPNKIEDIWDELKSDKDNSPLLNRASQGLYPPGSVFKIVTAAAAITDGYDDFEYECLGTEQFDDENIQCYDARVHGHESIEQAFASSCNTYFSTLGSLLGEGSLRSEAEKLLFNTPLPYSLPYSQSSFALKENDSLHALTQTSIGQGKTLVTPLHMAMITSAIANGGFLMEPYVIDHTLTYSNKIKNKTIPKNAGELFTSEQAELLAQWMRTAVTSGTGKQAAPDGIAVAGKTGTAQNSSGDDHGWFVGFAPVDNPEIAICVLLENCGGSSRTLPIAKNIIQYALKTSE